MLIREAIVGFDGLAVVAKWTYVGDARAYIDVWATLESIARRAAGCALFGDDQRITVWKRESTKTRRV